MISSITNFEDYYKYTNDEERDMFNQIIKVRRDELDHSLPVRKVLEESH